MKRKKKYLILLLSVIVLGTVLYKYMYKEHIDVSETTADFALESTAFLQNFLKDAEFASKEYLNKIIIVRGSISEQDAKSITLDSGILCYFLKSKPALIETVVKIKGRCIGYDELLEQVKLDQCSVIE